MLCFLHPVRPEHEIINDSLKGEGTAMILLLEGHSISGIPDLPQNNEEDGVPDYRIHLCR